MSSQRSGPHPSPLVLSLLALSPSLFSPCGPPQRSDDTASALKTRLASYHKETTPILNHYGPKYTNVVVKVNANQAAGAVWEEIESKL